MNKQREALQKAYSTIHSMLESGEWYEPWNVLNQIEEALAEPELEFWPGDVLICKEDGTKVTVANGNRGAMQLMNGKIAVAWDDNVFGEYTIEQIKEMFYQDEKPEPEQEPVAWRIADERDWEYRTKPPLEADIQWSAQYGRKYEPLYTSPAAFTPLTDEKVDTIITSNVTITDRNLYGAVYMAIREVEAAHGIGGEE